MRKIPYCVSFNPSEHKQHLFICGMSDKKILCVSISHKCGKVNRQKREIGSLILVYGSLGR